MVGYLRLLAVLFGAVGMAPAEVVSWTTASNNGTQVTCSTCEQGSLAGPPCVTTSTNSSLIEHLSGTFIHDAIFYGLVEELGGCQACGGVGGGIRPQSGLPSLTLARYYRSRVFDLAGSLGVDHFLSTDTNLRFDWSGPGGTHVTARYADPAELSTQQRFFEQVAPDAAVDGILHTTVGLFRDLRLYDAAHALTASALLATTAVITDHDGGIRTFEVINLGNGPTRYGRLLRSTNRVGIDVQTIAYRYPANASLADLGFDRSRLWQVAAVTAADQTQATYTYDTINRAGRYPVANILLPNGSTTTFHYSGDFLVSQDLPARGTATFMRSYDTVLQKIKTVIDDPAAIPGHQKKTVWWSGTSFILPNATVIAQSEGQLFRIDNAAGETMYMAWNDAQQTAALAANKYVWSSEKGLELFEVTDAAEQVSAYSRAPGFVFGQDPSAAHFEERTVYINDRAHQLVLGEIDPIGRRRNFTYDMTNRRLTSVTDAAGFMTLATYNDRAEPLTHTDEIGRTTTYTYDALGNQLSKTMGTGSEVSTWRWLYDDRGLVTAEIDANGNRTDQLFDARGRLIRVTEPADVSGGVRYARDFTYDGISRLTTVTDQGGRLVSYLYDVANRLIRRTYSDGSIEELIYGSGATAGLLAMEINRNGVPTTYAYDVAGRRIQTRIADGLPEVSAEIVTYAPGSSNRLSSRLLDGDLTTMIYDPQGQEISKNSFPRVGEPLTQMTVYDLVHRILAQRDAYDRWNYQVYDSCDRVVRTLRDMVPGPQGRPLEFPSALGSPAVVRTMAIALDSAVDFSDADVGNPDVPGYSDELPGHYFGIGGSGLPSLDQFHYLSSALPLASDVTLTVRIKYQQAPDPFSTASMSTAGLTLRQSLNADAPFVGLFVESGGGVSVQYRTAIGGLISGQDILLTNQISPVWLRAEMIDTLVHLSTSDDGVTWTELRVLPFQKANGARIGLSVKSNVQNAVSYVAFTNLSMIVHVPDAADVTVLTNDFLASLPPFPPGQNPLSIIEETDYDASGMPTVHRDGRYIRLATSYDSQARKTAIIEAQGTADAAMTSWKYDAQGNRIRVTNPRGFVTAMTYTGRNLLAEMTEASGTPNAATTAYAYSSTHEILKITDALGRITVNTYDPCCDRLTTTTDPAGYVTAFTYDLVGNRTSVTDANGLTMLTTYDGRNRPRTMTNGAGETMSTSYFQNAAVLPEAAGLNLGMGADGFAVSTTNPQHDRSLTIFDGLNRKVRQVDGLGHQWTWVYDKQVGSLVAISTIDPLGHTTSILQDGGGWTRVSLDELQQTTHTVHDTVGNVVVEFDPNSVIRFYDLDRRNREVRSRDNAGGVISKAYDANGNLVSITDAFGKTEIIQYDERDRKISMTDRIGSTTTFAYDAISNLVNITDAEGGVTLYSYDVRDLLVSEFFPESTSPIAYMSHGIYIYYIYDGGRRLKRRAFSYTLPPSLGVYSTAYDYDAANRIVKRHYLVSKELNDLFPPAPFVSEVSYDTFSYDTAGRLTTAISQQYSNQIARVYDAAGRMTKETLSFLDPGEAVDLPVSYDYDNNNRLALVTYPDGSQVRRAYTFRSELWRIWDGGDAQIIRGYDPGGRLGHTQFGNELDEFRTYVPRDNLTASISTTGNVTNFTYTYDANKRKTEERDWQNGSKSQRFVYDAQNRITGWSHGNGMADSAGENDTWQLSPVGDWKNFSRQSGSGSTSIENRIHSPIHKLLSINGLNLDYDSYKGRLTHDSQGQNFTWDFNDHLVTADHLAQGHGDSATYSYDALGRRVKKIVSTTSPAQTLPTYFVNAGSQEVMAITGDVTAFNDPTADPEEVGMAPYSPVTGEGARGSILAEPTATRCNFQPISSDTPDGWLADSGNLQPTPAQRGWTLARTPVDRDHLGRPLYDTFIQLDATTWKLPVANGTHAVVIMCGDADSRAQTNNLMVNGVSVTDPTPYDGNPLLGYETGAFDGYALTVNVVDGFITITAAAGALNPKINFIEIGAGGTAIDVPTIARAKTAAAQATHDTAKPKPKLPPAVKRSIWGDYVDELISFTRALPRHSAVRYFAHANSHYSVVALTNATGSVVERYSYSAYGERSGASLLENDRGFSGQRIDIETNLYDVRARMYSPTLGRFITRDVAYSDGFNLYEYVQGRPSDLLDLFGFASWNISNTTSMNLPVIGSAGAGVLATTIGSLSATTKCKCNKRVNKWYLDDTNVEFNINIDYWTDTNACKLHRPGLTYGWVKDRE